METRRILNIQNNIKTEVTNMEVKYFTISRLIIKARYTGASCNPNTEVVKATASDLKMISDNKMNLRPSWAERILMIN